MFMRFAIRNNLYLQFVPFVVTIFTWCNQVCMEAEFAGIRNRLDYWEKKAIQVTIKADIIESAFNVRW